MASLNMKRCFSLSAFLAFIEVRTYSTFHPTLSFTDVIASVKKLKDGVGGLDFNSALVLIDVLDKDLPWESSREGLRLFVFEWARIVEPMWLRLAPYGREKLRSALSDDEVQCFREAGLFDNTPDKDAIQWWDRISELMRGAANTERMVRARFAERLSLEYESNRLKALGIEREPQWISLEDNTLGYDILSYDVLGENIVSRLIEVKSTLSDTIFLTRNEWNNAISAADRTFFHVWRLPTKEFHEFSVAAMEPHIPTDRGDGIWQDIRVALSF